MLGLFGVVLAGVALAAARGTRRTTRPPSTPTPPAPLRVDPQPAQERDKLRI
jgi:hypothetical protein